LGAGSDVYLVDVRDGSVIVKTRARMAQFSDDLAPPALTLSLRQSFKSGLRSGSVSFEGLEFQSQRRSRFVAVYAQIPSTSWYVVNAIPYNSLVAEARALRNSMVLVASFGLLAAMLLSYVIWRSISEPLKQLMDAFRDAQAGNAPVIVAQAGRDELSVLSKKFSDMAYAIQREHESLEEHVRERTLALEQANLKLADLSATDGLTGIANRRRFDEVLGNEWRRAARLKQPLALAMIDIDWFKSYNDQYGHQAGDACLQRVATVLSLCVLRPGDLVARYGGEEFVFVAPATDGPNALRVARNVCEALQALDLPHATSEFGCVTASIGVAAMIAQDSQSPDVLVHAADQALYQAKAMGRNRAVLSAPQLVVGLA
jgi:diguanylate cyclase (GGDEF)-like protein